MNKRRDKIIRRLMCLAVSAGMIITGIPVQAEEFEAPADYESLFSSGEENDYTGSDAFESGTEPSKTVSSTPVPGENIPPTPTPAPDSAKDAESEDTENKTEKVTPAPTGELTPTPAQTVTPTPTEIPKTASVPDFDPEKEILVRYIDGDGQECTDLEAQVVEWDKAFTLPHVPDQTAKDIWKLEQEESLDDSVTFDGGETITLKKEESWDEFLQEGVLYLYMPQKYTVCLYNNSGTAVFPSGELKIYEGNDVTLPDITGTLYINYGWTDIPGSAEVKYPLNSSCRITRDQNFYIIRRAALQMTFLSQNGKTSSVFQALNLKIGKGLTFQIPEVPQYPGYQNLGWSLKKNAAQADYQPGQTIKASKSLTLYAVRKKYPYKIVFNNNSGTSTSTAYTSLTMYATKNQMITLPELPKAAGYQNLGWTTEKNSRVPLYEAGSQIQITKNTRLYAVRKKNQYYTVQFKRGDGTTSAAYKKLTMTVEEGTTITFPEVPSKSGYVSIGWSSRKNSETATRKTQYTVSRNITFYSVQKKEVQVILHKNNGDIYSRISVQKGGTCKLPGVKNASGYTFMGWSTKPMQSVSPEYEPEETITVNSTIDLYAVVFNRSTETELSADDLPQVNFYKYRRVVFVGDSRTEYMRNVLTALDKNVISNTEFICEAGKGLSWMRSTGYSKLYKLVENDSNSILGRKTAVIFNLGVNDMQNYKEYVAYYNMIAPILEKHGCELYFMSVNPINRKMLPNANRADRSEAKLRSFNEYLRTNLVSTYNYIDMYSYLKQTGYSFAKDSNGVSTVDDGLHYTTTTYKRIYAQCLKSLKGY